MAGATASSSTTTWQAKRNLTLSLGLRYERNSPVQTYAGRGGHAGRGLPDDHSVAHLSPTRSRGSSSPSPTNKDSRRRLGATYRVSEKTVVRAGYGIYYNPNQMNSFTFLTNNPPMATVWTFTSDPTNPTLSFEHPTGVRARQPLRHDLADAPSAERAQGSVELRRPAGAVGGHGAIDIGTSAPTRATSIASFFNNTPTPGPGAVDPRRPTSLFRSRRIIQNDLRR